MTSSAGDPATETTFRLMYRSHSRIPADRSRAELGELFSQARSSNKERGITGALLLTDEWFVQVLEGEEARVQGVYSRIAADPRHDSLAVIESGTVTGRVFSRWASIFHGTGATEVDSIEAAHAGLGQLVRQMGLLQEYQRTCAGTWASCSRWTTTW